jgi:hypothetical protein
MNGGTIRQPKIHVRLVVNMLLPAAVDPVTSRIMEVAVTVVWVTDVPVTGMPMDLVCLF